MPESQQAVKIYLNSDTHLAFKLLTTLEGTSMNQVINDLVEQWVAQMKQKHTGKLW